jgi:hypothetical protein
MSDWFGDPHTLVLARAPDGITLSPEARSTNAQKSGNRFAECAAAHMLLA